MQDVALNKKGGLKVYLNPTYGIMQTMPSCNYRRWHHAIKLHISVIFTFDDNAVLAYSSLGILKCLNGGMYFRDFILLVNQFKIKL